MTKKYYNTEPAQCSGYELDIIAKKFHKLHPNLSYAESLIEVLKNDKGLAKKYLKQEDEPKLATDGAIKPKGYNDAVQQLTDQAELFSLQYGVPQKLAFHRTLCRPENRLLAREYLSNTWKVKRT
jgi:hypothetical protein